jgi:perosamine synthetase
VTRPLAETHALPHDEPALPLGVRLRHVAPAGSPIRAGDLARWTGRVLTSSDALDTLRRVVCQTFAVRYCLPVSTGRAGLTVLLQAMSRLSPDRREVLVPAYTCFSVPASVVKAGLQPRLVDVDRTTLDMAPAALAQVDGRNVLAVIATNLYGMPNDLPALSIEAERMGAFLIDDAAQAMGASVGGRASGSWGDAGLYSLDKGKNISAIDGGLLVTRSEAIARELEQGAATLGRPGAVAVAKDAAKVLAYAAMLPPSVYWIPSSIPQLGLGLTAFTTEFPLDEMPSLLASLALTMLPRLESYNAQRTAHARTLIDQLAHVDGVRLPAPTPGSTPVYLRLPVLVDEPALRSPLIEALNRRGIGATGSYPTSLADVPGLQPHLANPGVAVPGARDVAARIVTLPTHPYVAARDLQRTVETVRATLRTRPVGARAGTAG